jgi:hypothetical protein
MAAPDRRSAKYPQGNQKMVRRTWVLSALVVSTLAMGNARAGFGFAPPQFIPVGGGPAAVAVGDITGDGRDDIVVGTTDASDPENDASVFIFRQQSDGTLQPPLKYRYTNHFPLNVSLVLADFDRDGVKDVILGSDVGIALLRGNTGPGFALEVLRDDRFYRVAATDLNRDGKIDIVGQLTPRGTIIFYGDGQGGIASQSGLDWLTNGRLVDMDGDGFEDAISVAETGSAIQIYLQHPSSGFGGVSRTIVPNLGGGFLFYAPGVGDFNGDGRMDIVAGSFAGTPPYTSVHFQKAGVRFPLSDRFETFSSPGGFRAADMNGDGRDDLLVAHDWSGIGLHLQTTEGLQQEQGVELPLFWNRAGVAVGDINSDGKMDAVTAGENVGLVLLYGMEQPERPDLSVSLGVNPAAVAIRLENRGEVEAITAPLVDIEISVRFGTLALGALPGNCLLHSQTERSKRLECLVDAVPSGDAVNLIVPVNISSSGAARNVLSVSAKAMTDTEESVLKNNYAWKQIVLAPGVGARSAIRTASRIHRSEPASRQSVP